MANQDSSTPIGKVDTIEGEVGVIRADGTIEQLESGDSVYQGDALETDANGSVGLHFVDDTVFSMGQNAAMTLDQMVFDGSTHEGAMALSITKGVFTFVSGQIAKSGVDSMALTSPVGVIGIRGTDGEPALRQVFSSPQISAVLY